ncbi:hypothetical protein MmarC5_0941 [Methanococcus maripaludis C5]|uniref:Uncharacterized protein n=2 Tax=Methanococcus maripaludis TaxID=39152 RepID=A0A7J9NTH5_METMI|nr:hypothetical protein [Methanococcus maripaludis]ABO35247.1 hypothetical protein MmarC5_0941 [Methanococcus maripaludis C5]MBA2846478.1 hypothetical protein [Methanococcus maripaludis]MBA2850962.1 hypothetical protein [Methanococcus maripaludis]
MYPEIERTYRLQKYVVKGRRPPEYKKVKTFSLNGEYLGSREVKVHVFVVEDRNENPYYLKTESNGLQPNDKIEVNYCYGDYKIKKVDKNG